MSFYFLAKSDGGSTDAAEYSVGREFTYFWNFYGGAISVEFIYLWNVWSAIQATFTYFWTIYGYLSKTWTYIWNVGYYIERQFTYIWTVYSVAADIGSKIKYSFKASAIVNRFHRMFRNG
jgi:hypothetical protein